MCIRDSDLGLRGDYHGSYVLLQRPCWAPGLPPAKSGPARKMETFMLWFESHRGSFASNLEQVANVLCAKVNWVDLTRPSALSRVGNEMTSSLRAAGQRSSVADWAVVCLMAASWVRVRRHWQWMAAVHCGIISSCQSAATSEIVKRFWSRVWLA